MTEPEIEKMLEHRRAMVLSVMFGAPEMQLGPCPPRKFSWITLLRQIQDLMWECPVSAIGRALMRISGAGWELERDEYD